MSDKKVRVIEEFELHGWNLGPEGFTPIGIIKKSREADMPKITDEHRKAAAAAGLVIAEEPAEVPEDEKISMTPEMFAAMTREMWPGVRDVIDAAVLAGRPVKIKAHRPTGLRPKEEAEDGRAHVVQGRLIKFIIVVDTGQENVSE